MKNKVMVVIGLLLGVARAEAQEFRLEQVNDSLSYVVLVTDSTEDRWQLPYPVYQFQTGDVDGDGSTDCMVGVIKPTRYYPTPARRLFIFKNFRGHVRPLWMGSKLGGILKDFRFLPDTEGGIIRAVESTTDGLFVVAEYRWQGFGMGFERFLAVKVSEEEADRVFRGVNH